MSNFFIPKKIKVGFQERGDTFTKKLAYIIYYDLKGKLCKETSWQNWRNKKIEPLDFDNEPTSGFILNKSVRRYSGSFSSGRNMIRIYDPRGLEFEITTDNLLGILLENDCNKRELSGQFVYGFANGKLILLPTNTEEYEKSAKFTDLKSKKVKAKDLIIGATYLTKDVDTLIYIGRYDFYEKTWHKRILNKNAFVYFDVKNNNYCHYANAAKIAECTNDVPADNLRKLQHNFLTKTNLSSSIDCLVPIPRDKEYITPDNSYYNRHFYIHYENLLYKVTYNISNYYYSENQNTEGLSLFNLPNLNTNLKSISHRKSYPFCINSIQQVIVNQQHNIIELSEKNFKQYESYPYTAFTRTWRYNESTINLFDINEVESFFGKNSLEARLIKAITIDQNCFCHIDIKYKNDYIERLE